MRPFVMAQDLFDFATTAMNFHQRHMELAREGKPGLWYHHVAFVVVPAYRKEVSDKGALRYNSTAAAAKRLRTHYEQLLEFNRGVRDAVERREAHRV